MKNSKKSALDVVELDKSDGIQCDTHVSAVVGFSLDEHALGFPMVEISVTGMIVQTLVHNQWIEVTDRIEEGTKRHFERKIEAKVYRRLEEW